MPNIKDWLADQPITMTKLAGPYESVSDDHWKHDAYVLRLDWKTPTEQRTSPELKYRMGVGHRVRKYDRRLGMHVQRALPQPEMLDVFESLVSDAACYEEAQDFADFCDNLGYTLDSAANIRLAEKAYAGCGEVAGWLTAFVGGHAVMQRLMYELERS